MTWDHALLAPRLAQVHFRRGVLLASMTSLGFDVRQRSLVLNLVQDVTRSSQIEGELLDAEQVRSSVARRLGLDVAGLPQPSRDVDGVVEMMLDATQRFNALVDTERLFGWHAALFPTGRSGLHRIEAGQWRTDALGPMQVVGGRVGRETVHFEAPAASRVPGEMQRFLNWLEDDEPLDPVVKAGVAHLYFLTVHPFEDGNGRIARALTDLLLARADGTAERFYSISTQIEAHRKTYYEVLERTQRAVDLDVTEWLFWFIERLDEALGQSESTLEKVRLRRCFWDRHTGQTFNTRQRKVLDLLLDGFEGKLKTEKYARITKCSPATAQRDLAGLVEIGALQLDPAAGGRSTSYRLNLAGC